MKNLLLAILGVIMAWLVLGFFTSNWDENGLIAMILGIVLGFNIRKPTKGEAS